MKISEIEENISHTSKHLRDIERKHKVVPGTDEWFKLWFSLPKLKKNNIVETRSFVPQMSLLQDLVKEYLFFTSMGQLGTADGVKSNDVKDKINDVLRTLAQSHRNLNTLDKSTLDRNKDKILNHIHDMMNYAIAHYREHLRPEYFDTKKKQINSVLTKYNAVLKNNLNESVEIKLYGNAERGYVLSKIEIPENLRGQGRGTEIMKQIVDRMDNEGAIIALTPDTVFGSAKGKLIDFYKRFGFVPNKGRNKDFRFRETMIRYPKKINEENIYDILEPEDCGPFDGGCVLVAQALQQIHGGEIVVLINDRGIADHAAVKVGNTLIDYDGSLPVDKFIKRFEKNELVNITGLRSIKPGDLPEATRNQSLLPKIVDLLSKKKKYSKVNEETGVEMLKIFRTMHHDTAKNKEMDAFIKSHDWELRDFTPNMFPTEEEFFDYDDPFDRVIDIDYGHRVDLSQPIIVGPQYSDGKYSVIDGNHRAARAQVLGKTIKGYFPVDRTNENFADGKNPGRKGLAKRMGVDCSKSETALRKIAKSSSGEKQRMAHWCANMKSGKIK